MKKKILFVIFSLFILPLCVNAGGVVDCSDVNGSDVLNNWGKNIGTLAGGSVYYCTATDKSDSQYNKGSIFELLYDGTQGKQRLYCLNYGLNAPTESTLTEVSTVWDKGPACAFYKYNGTGDEIRHNRIRYIQSKCTIKCTDSDDVSSTCCSTEQCTDDFISDDCVGDRKSEPSDNGNGITLSNLTNVSTGDSYFVYSVNVTKSGKVSSYTPSISPSISGAFVTDSLAGTTSVTDTTANTLYIKVPKSSVTSSISSNLQVVANYTISCTYKKFGLTYYKPTKAGVRVASEQRVAFREVEEVTPTATKTKEATISFALTPEASTVDYITVNKVDADTGASLPGANIGLFSDSTCSSPAVDSFGNSTVTTGGNGTGYFFVESNTGVYYLKELSAPSGYVASSSCEMASVDSIITIKNTKMPEEEKYGKIVVNKKDMASSVGIEGVKFELLMSDQSTSATDKDGNSIGVVTTDSTGKIEIPNLKYGIYYLKEISAPDNYIMSDELIEVVVNKEVVNVTAENALRNISFIKIDSVSKEAVAGGKYRIVDEAGNSVAEFTMDNGTYLMDIKEGKYAFIEVNPPKGYVDDNVSFEFEVSNEGIVNISSEEDRHYYINENMAITVVNDKEEIVPDVPKTGVLNNKIVIAIGTLLIIGGASSIVIIKRKNN